MDVLHADEAILIVNKPAGLPVLPDGWELEAPYAVKMLEENYGSGSGEAGAHIWVVHRLDKVTSGVMIFARSAEAHRALNRQFETHVAQKLYHAILVGLPKWDEKIARHPLRANVGHKHRTAVEDRAGKPAETQFKVTRRFGGHVLVEARLLTGRTHQIRAHAYALGHPLLGDTLYSAPPTKLIDRPALHAYSLTFIHPQTGQTESYTVPEPEDFLKALERLNKRTFERD